MHPASRSDQGRLAPAARPRILVVEDHWLVAMHARLLLEDRDCEVVGPVGTVGEASRLARDCDLVGAILDVELGDADSFPVAEILARREIPFAFATGFMASSLPAAFTGRPCFSKPYDSAMVGAILERIGVSPHA